MTAEKGCRLFYTLNGSAVEFELGAGSVVVGRSQGCDLRISDDSVSRRHAELTLEGDSWYIKDLGAKNGIVLNERTVANSRLSNGDRIKLGNVSFTYQSKARGLGISFLEDPTARSMKLDSISMEEASLLMSGVKDPGDDTLLSEANDWIPALMSEAAQSLLASGGLDEMFEAILSLAFAHMPAERACIGLCQEGDETVAVKLARSTNPADTEQLVISSTITSEVIRDRNSVVYLNSNSDAPRSQSITNLSLTSIMCAPLCVDGEVLGVIYLDTRDGNAPFKPTHLKVLTALAALSAVALRQASLREDVQREQRIRDRLSRYSSPHVVDRLVEGGGDDEGAGMYSEEAVASILFADLAGFTSLSETMTPSEVTLMLNAIFARLTEAVFEFEGTVDKFIGDEIMAFFGAPIAQEDHAERAVRCAVRMRECLVEFNASRPGEAELAMSIGINSGPVIVGDIGSPQRKDYTVIGDTVNTAKRIESQAAKGGKIVIGPATYELVKDCCRCEALPLMALKGKLEQLQLYSVEVSG
jgi:adenylate cyclase